MTDLRTAEQYEEISLDSRREEKGWIILGMSGKLTIRCGKAVANVVIRELRENRPLGLELAISEMKFIDSFGIGTLLTCHNKAAAILGRPGCFRLSVSPAFNRKLRLCGLDKVLQIEVVH